MIQVADAPTSPWPHLQQTVDWPDETSAGAPDISRHHVGSTMAEFLGKNLACGTIDCSVGLAAALDGGCLTTGQLLVTIAGLGCSQIMKARKLMLIRCGSPNSIRVVTPLAVAHFWRYQIVCGLLKERSDFQRLKCRFRDRYPAIDLPSTTSLGACRDVDSLQAPGLSQGSPNIQQRSLAKSQTEIPGQFHYLGHPCLIAIAECRSRGVDPLSVESCR